ncbi:hypothetical protein IWX78_002795 [Mycetocola sp. CAN_C7]
MALTAATAGVPGPSSGECQPDENPQNGTAGVCDDVARVGHARGDEHLCQLDGDRQAEAERHGQPPQATPEQQNEEQADRKEHADVGEELEVVVVDPGRGRIAVENAQHPKYQPVGVFVDRLRAERHPADERQVGEREEAEYRVAMKHPAILAQVSER